MEKGDLTLFSGEYQTRRGDASHPIKVDRGIEGGNGMKEGGALYVVLYVQGILIKPRR